MVQLTHHDVLALQDVVNIDDFVLLPQVRMPNISESLSLQRHGIIDAASSELARNSLTRGLLDSEQEYSNACHATGEEPEWVKTLPIHSQAWLRYYHATMHEDVLAIVPSLPYAGISYMFRSDGMSADIAGAFMIYRLEGVKQLGFLQAPWVAMSEQPMVTPITEGTRYTHSLDVTAVATLIGHRLGLSGGEFNTLRVAGLTHDWLTPAGGDSVKLIDPEAFDEDKNYGPMLKQRLDQDTWANLKQKYDIDETLLVETVLNKGLLGEILDIADKLAYVSRDIETCLTVILTPEDGDAYVGTRALSEIIVDFPYVCSIWDTVEQHGEHLVFADARRLIAFLKVRVVLFRELYFHPRARFGEYLVSRLLARSLYKSGQLTRDELLTMTDGGLGRRFDEAYGKYGITRALSLKCNFKSFEKPEQALAYKNELKANGHNFVLIEDHRILNKVGTHLLVKTSEGPKPLKDAYPGDANEIFEMANMYPSVHVYWLDSSEKILDADLAALEAALDTPPAD